MRNRAVEVDKELNQPINFAIYRFMGRFAKYRKFVQLMNTTARRANIGKDMEGMDCEERYIKSNHGGKDIRIRIFKPKNSSGKLPGMLYNHGGGYMSLVPEVFLDMMRKYIEARPCIIVAPDYRLSVDEPFPAGFNDCYDTLLWMKDNANEIGINAENIIVAGDSAGGGMTAAVTLKARDTKDVKIAFQIPVCPMIDCRQITESARTMQKAPIFNSNDNRIAWDYYLEKIEGDVPAYASPSLNEDYTDFPPTISMVGSVEPFRDESIKYIESLEKYNIPVRFRVFKGAYHGFQEAVPEAKIAQEGSKFLRESYIEFYDKYIK